jgi:parallel beta-helix repeat protein
MVSKLRPNTTRRQLFSMAAIVALVMAGLQIVGGDRALASHVSCGATITTDTMLDSDLVNCSNNGIVIGADNITLDLNGHTIDGDGEPFASCPENEFCDIGVLNDGHDGITVMNGSIGEFAVGAFVGRARHNRVLGISSSRNVFFGFVVTESARSLVRDSSGSGNLRPDGDGMGVFGSHDIRVLQSSFRHNPLGMHIEDSADNLIKENDISGNSGPGLLIQADNNEVRRNMCARNKSACIIVSSGDRNLIARNHGFRDGGGIGIEEGKRNLVTRNEIVRPRKTGISLGFRPQFGGGHNVVRRNEVRGTGFDGFLVTQKDDHSVLGRNVAKGAGDDGFDIESASATLTRNLAIRNDDLGIAAVRGVIDGGGNIARHNRDPRQCTAILCR